ncbi:MAG: alanine--tRNA ligase, partial [Candidatus Latescibacteria bacterium]|nr:alanine--tRNA ligase [Candidatus Latescibacterota bacterium]
SLTPLPRPSIDTGLGLERIAAVMQKVPSNFETDLFRPLIAEVEEIVKKGYSSGPAGMPFRVIADHVRALTFVLADGALPSNEGRGYVLRRILRRAARFGRNLGMHEPFIYKLAPKVVDIMGEAYPELRDRCQYVSLVIKGEEESFGKTLDRGIEIFEGIADDLKRKEVKIIPGKDVFKLYDTYGFPLDLTQLMAREKGLSVDTTGFEREMKKQRERSRDVSKLERYLEDIEGWKCLDKSIKSVKLKPEQDEYGHYLYSLEDMTAYKVRKSGENGTIEIIFDRTPFYAEAGGQVSDTGELTKGDIEIEISDVIRTIEGPSHKGKLIKGDFSSLDELAGRWKGVVDISSRKSIERNHTATHLLQAALRQVLGEHVRQSGSLVAPDRLRFDFTHFSPLSSRELDRVEAAVNARIREDISVSTFENSLEEAKTMGALAFFGEKYEERVRLVKITDTSLELCGGTHVKATGQIGQFRLISESGISAGIRRIEAVTGETAESKNREERRALTEIQELLNVPLPQLGGKLKKLIERNKALEKEQQQLRTVVFDSNIDQL